MQISTLPWGRMALSSGLLGLLVVAGCSSSTEPVAVDMGEDDIAAYEAAMEGAEGGYSEDAGNDDR